MRYTILGIFIATVLTALMFLEKIKLPMIFLPKGAQHNTIGELPIVEVMDDGDFYEKDGDEEKYRAQQIIEECTGSLIDQCDAKLTIQGKHNKLIWKKRTKKDKTNCIKNVERLCLGGIPDCEELRKWGLMWTCNTLRFQ